jgi:formate dehydrogenase
VRITTVAGRAEASVEVSAAMQPGHVSLPNGFGVDDADANGRAVIPGVAPNELTSTQWRDAYAGTPWHKHVPARIELAGV